MKYCSQLADTEALVLGELEVAHAGRLREHARSCAQCRDEIALVGAERALFARRAEVMSEPPPVLAAVVRRRLDAERSPLRRMLAPAVGRLLRRGHVSAASAAALFLVAAFSRTGTTTMVGAASIVADGETNASGMLASFRNDEPAACSPGSAPSVSFDDGAMSSPSAHGASRGEKLACRVSPEGSRSSLPCEPFVTCSWFRQ